MPYTDVDIFREKGTKSVSKKNLEVTEFYEKMGKNSYLFDEFLCNLGFFFGMSGPV
jgi:hypothetical protein